MGIKRPGSAEERGGRRENILGISAVVAASLLIGTCTHRVSTKDRRNSRDEIEQSADLVNDPEFATESANLLSSFADNITNNDPNLINGQPANDPSPFSITTNPGLNCLDISNPRWSWSNRRESHWGKVAECREDLNAIIFSSDEGFIHYNSGIVEDKAGNLYAINLRGSDWGSRSYMIDTDGNVHLLPRIYNSAELGPSDEDDAERFHRLKNRYLSAGLILDDPSIEEAAHKLATAHEASKVILVKKQVEFDHLVPKLEEALKPLTGQTPEAFFTQAIELNSLYLAMQSLEPRKIDREDQYYEFHDRTQEWFSENLTQIESLLTSEGRTSFEYQEVADFLNTLKDGLYGQLEASKVIRIGFDNIETEGELHEVMLKIEADGNRAFIDPVSLIANANRLSGKEKGGNVEKYESYFRKRGIKDKEAFEKFAHDPRVVAHEIVQTQGRYSTRSNNMATIIERRGDPYAECEGRLEHAYSRWHRFFVDQYKTTVEITDGHVRLLVDINGVHYAIEDGTPMVIDLSNRLLVDPHDYLYARILGRPATGTYNGRGISLEGNEKSTIELQNNKRGTPNYLGPLIIPSDLRLVDLGGSTKEQHHQPKKRPYKTKRQLRKEKLGGAPFSEEFGKLISYLPDDFKRKHSPLLQQVLNDPLNTDACNDLAFELRRVHYNYSVWILAHMAHNNIANAYSYYLLAHTARNTHPDVEEFIAKAFKDGGEKASYWVNLAFEDNFNWAIDMFLPKDGRLFIRTNQSCRYEYLESQNLDHLIQVVSDDRLGNEHLARFLVNQLLFHDQIDEAKALVTRTLSLGHNHHVETLHRMDGKIETTYFSNFIGSDEWNWCISEG